MINFKNIFCLPATKAQEFIDKYNPERIIKNLAYVEEKINTGKVKDIGAYTLKAIKENYILQRSQFDIDKEEKEQAKRKKEEQEWRELKLQEKYEKYRRQRIKEYKEELIQGGS